MTTSSITDLSATIARLQTSNPSAAGRAIRHFLASEIADPIEDVRISCEDARRRWAELIAQTRRRSPDAADRIVALTRVSRGAWLVHQAAKVLADLFATTGQGELDGRIRYFLVADVAEMIEKGERTAEQAKAIWTQGIALLRQRAPEVAARVVEVTGASDQAWLLDGSDVGVASVSRLAAPMRTRRGAHKSTKRLGYVRKAVV